MRKDRLLKKFGYEIENRSVEASLKTMELARKYLPDDYKGKMYFSLGRQILNEVVARRRGPSKKPIKLPKPKTEKKPRKKKNGIGKDFYDSWEWKKVRYEALMKHGAVCMLCGADRKTSVIHVDHIKPTSKFPELALSLDNLQVLCKSCNMGKSNIHQHDFR